jgi:hypothetical protein
VTHNHLYPDLPQPARQRGASFCTTCDQLVQKDLDYCPYDGRSLPPLERHAASDPDEPIGSS